MSNLPISTQTPQSSGSSISPASASNVTNDQEATPFASVLARRIGEPPSGDANAVPFTLNAVPFTLMSDAATPLKKGIQEETSVAHDPGNVIAITPSDPSSTLATIMLQLPQELRPHARVEPSATTAQQTLARDSAALIAASGVDANPANIATPATPRNEAQLAAVERNRPDKLFTPAGAADKAIVTLSLLQDAPKYPGLSAVQADRNNTPANITALLAGASTNAATLNRSNDNALTINTPLGNNGWAEDFSQQISWMSTHKNQVAELHLNPPNLGPLDVVLTITDKQATLQFSSPHSAVRDAVENALPKLREVFADNGIMLGNTTVSDQTPRERNAAGFMNQESRHEAPHNTAENATQLMSLAPADTPNPAVRRHIGMVDTFA